MASLTLANGADTFGVLLPLFAETAQPWSYMLAATVVSGRSGCGLRWLSGSPCTRGYAQPSRA